MSVVPQSYQLSDYLEKLPGTTFRKLYQQPSTAFAIFRRMLPPLGTWCCPSPARPARSRSPVLSRPVPSRLQSSRRAT